MTNDRAIRALAAILVAIASACSATGTEPTTSAVGSRPTEVVESSVAASLTPSVALPTQEPQTPEPPIAEPPAATIAVEGGDPVVGQLGSFTWRNAGSDSPWLDGNPIHVARGEQLTLGFAQPVELDMWTIAGAPAAANGSNPVGMGDGTDEAVTFAAPPPGTWTVNVSVWFADNEGSAAYYWLVEVE